MHWPIKMHTKRLLRAAGVHVQRAGTVRPLNLTGTRDFDPLTSVYASGGHTILAKVPLARCRHFNWLAFPCTSESDSPFIRTLIEYQKGSCRSYSGSHLEDFYGSFKPRSAAELMGVEGIVCKNLVSAPPAGAPLFWRPESIDQNIAMWERIIAKDNNEQGARFGLAEGNSFYGPVSVRKGQLEFDRLIGIYENIKRLGYRVDYHGFNNIDAVCLISDKRNDWKCLLASSGQHRVAALVALGHEDIVIQINSAEGTGGLVRRADARHWPTVRAGYLTEAEAVGIFDRMFEGVHPWVEAHLNPFGEMATPA